MFSLIWHEDEVGLDTSLNSCNESEQMKTFLPTFYKQKKGGGSGGTLRELEGVLR